MEASYLGSTEIVNALLKGDVNVDWKDKVCCPMRVVRMSHLPAVWAHRFLLCLKLSSSRCSEGPFGGWKSRRELSR